MLSRSDSERALSGPLCLVYFPSSMGGCPGVNKGSKSCLSPRGQFWVLVAARESPPPPICFSLFLPIKEYPRWLPFFSLKHPSLNSSGRLGQRSIVGCWRCLSLGTCSSVGTPRPRERRRLGSDVVGLRSNVTLLSLEALLTPLGLLERWGERRPGDCPSPVAVAEQSQRRPCEVGR